MVVQKSLPGLGRRPAELSQNSGHGALGEGDAEHFQLAMNPGGPAARDTITEEEVVLFDVPATGQVRPVWHQRIETDEYGVWRSITPEVASTSQGTTLLSVMSCVNGTGGCDQEFLQRHANGMWHGVRQDWLDQLPAGFMGRIRHGIRIDPAGLRGQAGFYGDHDPNCCPSERLIVDLELRGDSLVLRHQAVISVP